MPPDTTSKSATTTADGSVDNKLDNSANQKSDEKFDRFHPEMPTIPGIGDAPASSQARSSTTPIVVDKERLARIVGVIAAIFLVVVIASWWIRHSPRTAGESHSADSVDADSALANLPPLPSAARSPEDPSVAATVEQLSKTWSSKKFTYVKPLTHETVDAMVVRLPGGGLWAFALREPFGQCDLEFVTDIAQIEQKFRYRANHPMLVNPCTSTVYDPLKVGPLEGNTWARGEVVQGSGLRPPISIDVVVQGQSIVADGIE
jgi:hypothetical protein